jgi:hypothetical protein
MPRVERNVWLPSAGERTLAQALVTNQVDMRFRRSRARSRRAGRRRSALSTQVVVPNDPAEGASALPGLHHLRRRGHLAV